MGYTLDKLRGEEREERWNEREGRRREEEMGGKGMKRKREEHK